MYFKLDCRGCGQPCAKTYCQACIDEDTSSTDAWERRYVERCDASTDSAYERCLEDSADRR